MKKRFAIFWIEMKNGGDGYHTLGTLWKIVDSQDEAEQEIGKIYLSPTDLVTIMPVYSGEE